MIPRNQPPLTREQVYNLIEDRPRTPPGTLKMGDMPEYDKQADSSKKQEDSSNSP